MTTLISILMMIGLWVAMFAVFIAIAVWASKLSSKFRPYYFDEPECVISPGKASAFFLIAISLIMLIGGISTILLDTNPDKYFLAVPLILMGAAGIVFFAPSLTHMHDLKWNDQFVEGASTTFGSTLGNQRTRIYWSDIKRTGLTLSGYWYIQSNDYQKIYWNSMYRGFRYFQTALVEKCPHLKLGRQ